MSSNEMSENILMFCCFYLQVDGIHGFVHRFVMYPIWQVIQSMNPYMERFQRQDEDEHTKHR